MPFSAYVKAGLFVVAAAAALFAAAGTVAIPGFWAYLAIFAVVMIVSFATLDPDLLRERMRPGGKKPPRALRIFSLVLFIHLDRHFKNSPATIIRMPIVGMFHTSAL